MVRGFAIVLLLGCSAAWAQSEQGRIAGWVRDHKSLQPIPSASVRFGTSRRMWSGR